MTEDKGCIFVKYTVIAMVYMIRTYHGDIILTQYYNEEPVKSFDHFSQSNKTGSEEILSHYFGACEL